MAFDRDDLEFQLLDVLVFKDQGIDYRVPPRPFCALSLRFDGDTDIVTDKQKLHLQGGDLAFFPPETPYYRTSRHDEMIVFHFKLTRGDAPERIEVRHNADVDALRPLFEEALRVWQERQPGYRYKTAALLYEIFALLSAAHPAPTAEPPALVRAAMERMQQELPHPALTVETVARHLHVSQTYLRRAFHAALGLSPKTYLFTLRMERAKSLLNAGYDPVAAVAEKCGYRDAKNFATAYKKHFGYPPSQQHYD